VAIPRHTKSKNSRLTALETRTPLVTATPKITGCCLDRMNLPE
jgi:hypothetical protein